MKKFGQEELIVIAKAIALSMGDHCETVVHDEEKRIVFIENGHISGREAGHIMDDTVFEYLSHKARSQENTVIRLTKNKDGSLLKSTTIMFFDEAGSYYAMMCFTIDMTDINRARNILDSIMNVQSFEDKEETDGNMNIVEYTRRVISDIIKEVGKPSTLGSKEIKLTIIRKLDEKGVFLIKDSVPQICDMLSISQATMYNYLREIRTETSKLIPFRQ